MALFDKLNQVAKTIGEKAGDAIESTKLQTKIVSETKLAEEELKKIGEYYYNAFVQNAEAPEEILEFLNNAKVHYEKVAQYELEISELKDDAATADEPVKEAEPAEIVCPSCKAINAPETKFCSNCGMKLE